MKMVDLYSYTVAVSLQKEVLVSHQQQVLSRDPDRVGEGVVILILYKLLGVSCPHFNLNKQSIRADTGVST